MQVVSQFTNGGVGLEDRPIIALPLGVRWGGYSAYIPPLLKVRCTTDLCTTSTPSTMHEIPFCPVFSPSPEDFADPLRYIKKIRAVGEKYGEICEAGTLETHVSHLLHLRALHMRVSRPTVVGMCTCAT